MNKYKTQDGIFFVEIQQASQEKINSYYTTNNELKTSGNSDNNPRIFKKAIIKHTFCEEKYPIDSVWMMGEVPGMKINFYGEKLILIQEKDLYAKIT